MPHIIVEYSDTLKDLKLSVLLVELHDALAKQETIDKKQIKTRAIPVQHSFVGDESLPNQMMHITLKVLPGRNMALRKTFANSLFSTACGEVRPLYPKATITVEVVELDETTYTR